MGTSVSSAFDDISTTMAETQALVNAIEGRFEALPKSKPYTISRVPAYIRQTNKKMYEPMVIAIGPYHHRTEHLQAAEEHKCRYLRSLLSRPTTRASLGVLFEKLKALEQEARSHYSESIDFKSDKFVKMMILDGCFIIEFFLNYHHKDRSCDTMGCEEAIPSATELREAGVRFRKKSSPRHMLEITFQDGIMEIPFIQIDDYTKPTLTNLIAFEQSVLDGPKNITDFSVLMDLLINTEKDVAILQRCGVIETLLGSDEEVALFFNQLCYRKSKWHRYRARLVHDHFSNPWAFLSLLAALVLLILTFMQSFFAIYAYFRPP